MSDLALALLTALLGTLKSRRDLVLENLALRHQLVVLSSSDKRPRFSSADRLVWTCLRRFGMAGKGLSSSFSRQPSFAGTGKDSAATGDASLFVGREGQGSIQNFGR